MSVVHKTHATDNTGMEFVLSDATPDRYGDTITASGWVLDNFRKNPIALFNHDPNFPIGRWENLRSGDALRGHLQMAPAGTSPRIDEIRRLIDAGILKAVSVGFRPIESKPLAKGGLNYTSQELVETSLVSVPANPNALAVARSMKISREVIDVVFAKHGSSGDMPARNGNRGEHARTSLSGKNQNMSISQRIEDTQTKVNGLRDQLNAHLDSLGDAPDDAATALTDDLTTQLESQERSLESFKRAETQLARGLGTTSRQPAVNPAARTPQAQPHEDRGSTQEMVISNRSVASYKPFAMAGKKVTPLDYLFRAITVDIKHFGEGRKRPILEVLKESYGDNDMGECVRTVMSRMVTKAAAIPADTTTSGWADTLVQTVIGEFIPSLLPHSVYPALAAKGGSFTFGRNGTISLPARNTSTTVAGAFVAQGAPIPVRQGAFTAITLTPKKMGVITTLTREITEHSTPSIEAIIRQAMLEDTGVAIDTILLDATASSTTRPAGLKNGISKVNASATTTIAGFIADITGLAAALITATNGNIRNPVWIMNPGDVLKASLLQTTTGDTPFRDELAGGTLLGYPVIQTTTGLSDMMALMDAADFITATGDTPQFSVSDQAVLHMEDTTPLAISTVATPNTVAAPVRSLWQTDSMAIRMILDINWAKRRTGIFQWTDTMAWN